MIEGIQLMYKDNPSKMSFQILWSAYKAGYIALNEGIFIENMYNINWFKADEHLTKYLLKHPETVVLFPSVPTYIQDTIFTTEEWKKIYHTLDKKGYFTNKNAILHAFIETLLNPWKKNVLDMYCRWIENLEPSHQELLSSQHTLFALLSSDKTSVVNFVMKLIKEISSEKEFDFQAFADNFALCFAVQKIAKSQLIGLGILEKYYKKQAPAYPDYREQLAVLFTIPDVKLQEKVASLLTTYFGGEGLADVVAPYEDYLKGNPAPPPPPPPPPREEGGEKSLNQYNDLSSQLLDCPPSGKSARAEYVEGLNSHTSQIAYAARTPRTWDDLLFLIGDYIRERSPLVLDLFFEGLNQLQAQTPADYPELVKPYLNQLLSNERAVTSLFYQFLDSWCNQSPIPLVYNTNKEWEELQELYKEKKYSQAEKFNKLREIHVSANKAKKIFPFFFNKIACTLLKLKEKDTLPFISTPTHAPFYIEPITFLERIIQYEKAGKTPMQEDVIIGLNRLLPTEITEAQKQLALSLTGDYTPALQYYFEVNRQIAVTDATRVLWGQVLRLKVGASVLSEIRSRTYQNQRCRTK